MDLPAVSQSNRGQCDPGWNDPPTFSYTGQTSVSKPKNLLNKRVAFPLSSPLSSAIPNATMPPSLPPGLVPLSNTTPLIPYNPGVVNQLPENFPLSCSTGDRNGTVSLNDVTIILNRILEDSPELGSKLDNIRKRLCVMESMWEEGKLVEDVQVKMLKISRALENSDTAAADELHKSLMIDHIGSVGNWMVAIKQLIFHCTAKNELLAIDNES